MFNIFICESIIIFMLFIKTPLQFNPLSLLHSFERLAKIIFQMKKKNMDFFVAFFALLTSLAILALELVPIVSCDSHKFDNLFSNNNLSFTTIHSLYSKGKFITTLCNMIELPVSFCPHIFLSEVTFKRIKKLMRFFNNLFWKPYFLLYPVIRAINIFPHPFRASPNFSLHLSNMVDKIDNKDNQNDSG